MIVVVGATGKTGLVLVEALLAAGRSVRAFARSAGAMAPRDRLEVVAGDVLDVSAVEAAVAGSAAVISLLGPGRHSPPGLCGAGTQHIVSAMRKAGVRRLVCVTGAIIGHPHEKLGLVYRLIERHVPADDLADRRAEEDVVMQSGLDWTLVRPTRLTDAPAAASIRAGDDFVVTALAHVPRANVARFLVASLDDPTTIGRAFTLTTP